MNEVVKYHNNMNSVAFRKFTSNEMDLFFAICSKMKEQEANTVRFEFSQLRRLSNYKPTSIKRFTDDLNKTYTKMLNLTYGTQTETRIQRFVLFTDFDLNITDQYVDITVNTKLEYFLNELTSNFTRFELEEFTKLNSSYAKTMYRLLKQYKSTGFYTVSIEEFRRILDIPQSYRMSEINKWVLSPIKKELCPLFNRFEIEKIKKKGNKISQLNFNFSEKDSKKNLEVPLHNWLD